MRHLTRNITVTINIFYSSLIWRKARYSMMDDFLAS